jgi:non-specific riboncleoside hydrolase
MKEENTMEKRKIIIDTDPGIDDAIAILVALFSERLEVELITTVAGNVSVEQTTENALRLRKFAGKSVPVAKGCPKPLLAPPRDAANIHGETGMGGYDFPALGEGDLPLTKHAVEAMRDLLMASSEKITLVPIGPLTNIALLLSLYPECKEKIERIVMMGGSVTRGNEMPMAEFNIFVDPEAASIVFASGLDIVMCGLDVTNKALLTKRNVDELKGFNKTGQAIYQMFKHYRGGSLNTGFKMHDASAIAFLLRPDLFTVQQTHVAVETRGELTYGCIVADLRDKLGLPPNATVCLDIDAEGFSQWLVGALKMCV